MDDVKQLRQEFDDLDVRLKVLEAGVLPVDTPAVDAPVDTPEDPSQDSLEESNQTPVETSPVDTPAVDDALSPIAQDVQADADGQVEIIVNGHVYVVSGEWVNNVGQVLEAANDDGAVKLLMQGSEVFVHQDDLKAVL